MSVLARMRRFLGRLAPTTFGVPEGLTPAQLGLLGERVAARYLAARGWRVRARRLRTRHAELDLVACRGDTLAVVEVKTGNALAVPRPRGAPAPSGDRDRPGRRLDDRALERRRRAARALARELGYARSRVDLVEVHIERGRPVVVHTPDLRRALGR